MKILNGGVPESDSAPMNVSVPRSGMEVSTPFTFAMFVEPKRAWILPEAKNMSGFAKRMAQHVQQCPVEADRDRRCRRRGR